MKNNKVRYFRLIKIQIPLMYINTEIIKENTGDFPENPSWSHSHGKPRERDQA